MASAGDVSVMCKLCGVIGPNGDTGSIAESSAKSRVAVGSEVSARGARRTYA